MKFKNWVLMMLLVSPLVGCHRPSNLEKQLKADVKEWVEITEEEYTQVILNSRKDGAYEIPRGFKVGSGMYERLCVFFGGKTMANFFPQGVSFTISYENPERYHKVYFWNNGEVEVTEYYHLEAQPVTKPEKREEIIDRLKERLPKNYLPN